MKDSLTYSFYNSFVVRAPLLTLKTFLNCLEDEGSSYNNMKTIIQQPKVAEALFIASPDYYKRLQGWLDGASVNSKKEERFLQSIYKYLSRMATRCTPFGLFAGCGVGRIGENTEVLLTDTSDIRRHTRLDMSYLCNLAQSLAKVDTIKTKLLYYPNNSIYKAGEKLRYIEYRFKKDERTYHLVEVVSSQYLSLVLKNAQNGKSIHDLAQSLEHEGITYEQSRDFMDTLIDNQILISELNPTVTGEEFLRKILKVLSPNDQINEVKNVLIRTVKRLELIDQRIGNSLEEYYDIANDLRQLGVAFNMKHLFQTDTFLKPLKATVSKQTLDSIEEGVLLLAKLSSRAEDSRLIQFTKAFINRYENRECELLTVLDTEIGIGYSQANRNGEGDISPLISGIVLQPQENELIKLDWDSTKQFLYNKIQNAINSEIYEVEITKEEVRSLKSSWHDLPPTFCCKVKIVEPSSSRFPGGKILLEGAGGSNAAYLLGRFCHGDGQILKLVQEICYFESSTYSDAIFAEIVHLPQARAGNVILRPAFREYEIPILTSHSVKPAHTISLSDLYISVRNNEIVLRSKKLQKRIIPRLSNAHNFANSTFPAYQFLCDLQTQNLKSSIGINLGSFSNFFTFMPRIIYSNLIISPATWVLNKEVLLRFSNISGDKELMKEVKWWTSKNGIPEMVLLKSNDNPLFVKFDSLLSIKTLLSTVKNWNRIILQEFLFNPENAVVKDSVGGFTNEFVFALYKNSERYGSA